MISISNLCYSYPGAAQPVLRGISAHMVRGAWVSVIGESGCGKSTLLRLILGFDKPISGEIVCSVPRTRIGFLPQFSDSSYADFPITVKEAMLSYARLKSLAEAGFFKRFFVKKADLEKEVNELLGLVHLSHKSKDLIGTLSRGELERFLVARALTGHAPLLILDEPSTGLDPVRRHELYELLSGIRASRGVSILAVEHNIEDCVRYSSEIYRLRDGLLQRVAPEEAVRS